MSFFYLLNSDPAPRNFFQGYAFTSDSLVFNTLGLFKFYAKEKKTLYDNVDDGRFLLIENVNDDEVFIRGDPAGQYVVYYYVDGRRWVISDSILLITERLKEQGVKLKPYSNSIDVFKNDSLSLVGGQLLSNNTPVSGIKILPLDLTIKINYKNQSPSLSFIKNTKNNFSLSYEAFLSKFISQWRAKTRALSNLGKENFLALSGGVDSRAVLSMLSTNRSVEKVKCHSHEANDNEYCIAKKLCEITNVALVNGQKSYGNIRINPSDSYRISALSNAGLKTNYSFRSSLARKRSFHYIGGCVVGSYYMQNSFEQRVKGFKKTYGPGVGDNVSDELALSLDEMQIERNDPWAMFHHYYSFRARFHYGNDCYTKFGALQVNPFLDPLLQRIPSLLEKNYVSANGFMRDVISISNSSLLSIGFDKENKIPVEAINLNLAKVKLDFFEYNIYCDTGGLDTHLEGVDYKECSLDKEVWLEGLSEILCKKKKDIETMGSDFNFSKDYVNKALFEIENFNKLKSLKKSGVLLGLSELFL